MIIWKTKSVGRWQQQKTIVWVNSPTRITEAE